MPCEVCIPNLHYQCCVSIQPGNSKHLTTPTLNIFSNPSTAVYIYSMSHVWYRRDHNMNYQLSPTSSSIEDCLHSTQLFGDIVQSLQEGYIINMVAARTTNWYRYSQMSLQSCLHFAQCYMWQWELFWKQEELCSFNPYWKYSCQPYANPVKYITCTCLSFTGG